MNPYDGMFHMSVKQIPKLNNGQLQSTSFEVHNKTLDQDKMLNPDYIASTPNQPFFQSDSKKPIPFNRQSIKLSNQLSKEMNTKGYN